MHSSLGITTSAAGHHKKETDRFGHTHGNTHTHRLCRRVVEGRKHEQSDAISIFPNRRTSSGLIAFGE